MTTQRYDFLTKWRFDDAKIEEVADIIADTALLPSWWPELFRTVTIVKPGTGHGLGQIAACTCKARLPYTLRFTYTCVEDRYPHGSKIESSGDLNGRGEWKMSERAGGVDVEYAWQVDLEKPILRFLSPLLRPLLAGNHEWSMRKGEDGLRREIVRRRNLRRSA
jgi:hypothetical protein